MWVWLIGDGCVALRWPGGDPRCRRSRRIHYIPIKHPSRHCSWGQTPISTQVTRISFPVFLYTRDDDNRLILLADAPHAMCHFESALRVTCRMTLMLKILSPSLPGVNGRFCQDSWPCFLLRMWEGSDLCCTQHGCRTPNALVLLNRFIFLSSWETWRPPQSLF